MQADVRALPAPLRAWLPLAPLAPRRLTTAAGSRLARALLEPNQAYAGADGFVMRIDPTDRFQVAMLTGAYDPLAEALVARYARPGSAVVDAGAHLGYFTLRLARAVGPQGSVHAFECDPRLIPRLREHVTLNRLDRVHVEQFAAAERSGDELTLHLPAQLGWASLRAGIWPDEATAKVRTAAIDDVLDNADVAAGDVSFVKLDVEGAELDALRGLSRTLERGRPALLVEYIPWRMRALGQDPEDMLGVLAEAGYTPWSPRRRLGRVVLTPGVEPGAGEDVLFLKR